MKAELKEAFRVYDKDAQVSQSVAAVAVAAVVVTHDELVNRYRVESVTLGDLISHPEQNIFIR
jgi:hypothetical protein